MELERFEKAFSKLTDLFSEQGFYNNPNRFEIDVYGKIIDYELQALIITERLEEDISNDKSHTKYVFGSLEEGKDINDDEMKKDILNHVKLNLDLSDFYIYTRLFLDALTVGIKRSFLYTGNKYKCMIGDSVSCLLNSNMQTYKEQIDPVFFGNLEKKLAWIKDFREARIGLVHKYHHFVFTTTRQGELGYDIMDREKVEWGTDTVKSISAEVQTVINNLCELLEYLYDCLPGKDTKNIKMEL